MPIQRKVKKAVDGDTLEVGTKIRGTNYIRIAGKNSPERGERGYTAEKNKLNRLAGKTITIVPKGRSYNRIVADVKHRGKKIK